MKMLIPGFKFEFTRSLSPSVEGFAEKEVDKTKIFDKNGVFLTEKVVSKWWIFDKKGYLVNQIVFQILIFLLSLKF